MKEYVQGVLLVVVAVTVFALAGALVPVQATPTPEQVVVRVPVCAEDEGYLKGKGDFDGTRWARYVCVHNERVSP